MTWNVEALCMTKWIQIAWQTHSLHICVLCGIVQEDANLKSGYIICNLIIYYVHLAYLFRFDSWMPLRLGRNPIPLLQSNPGKLMILVLVRVAKRRSLP